MGIARYYDETKQEYNAAGEPLKSYPGVPLADIADELWETYPDYVKADVDAGDLYRKTEKRAKPKTEDGA